MSCLSEKGGAKRRPRTKLRDTQLFSSQEKEEVLGKEPELEQPNGRNAKKSAVSPKLIKESQKRTTVSNVANSSSYKQTET